MYSKGVALVCMIIKSTTAIHNTTRSQTRRWRSCWTSCRALCVWRSTAGPECCPVCTSSARPVWRSLRWHREAGSVHRAPTAASRPCSPKGAWPACPLPSTSNTCLRKRMPWRRCVTPRRSATSVGRERHRASVATAASSSASCVWTCTASGENSRATRSPASTRFKKPPQRWSLPRR